MAVLCLLTNTPWPWPTPARAASATERGITHLERSGGPSQTGLHKRSAEDWGYSLRAPGAELLRRFGFLVGRGAQELLLGSALRSGKEAASLPLPPLRTGLDGFSSSGSSRV
jgi:hypothetical protein